MTEDATIARPQDGLPYVRVFELIHGSEFMVFFAASEDELPDDHVRRELRVLALHDREDQKRSVTGTIVTDVISGAIGGGTWAAISRTYTALAEYLKRKHGSRAADATVIIERLAVASEKLLGPAPPALEDVKVRQLEDSRWEAQFTRHGIAVRATLDPGGTVIKWRQHPTKHVYSTPQAQALGR